MVMVCPQHQHQLSCCPRIGFRLCPELIAHGSGSIPVQIQNQPDSRIFRQNFFCRFPGAAVRAVIGRIVVEGGVMDHPDALLLQNFRHPAADAQHIPVLIQGAVGAALFVVLPLLGIALRGVGVENQHPFFPVCQIPVQALGQQSLQIRPMLAAVADGDVLRLLPGEHRPVRLGQHRGRGFPGKCRHGVLPG